MMERNKQGKFIGGQGYWNGKKMGKMSDTQKKKIGAGVKKRFEENPEIKLKIKQNSPKYWLGKKRPNLHSLETKQRLSEMHKGDKSPLWKGGLTESNKLIRGSLEYRLWRTAVFERDKYTCVWCKQVGDRLEADHIKRFSDYPELRFAIDNGRTLCKPCHKTTETYGRKR